MREYTGDKAEVDRAANRRASSMLGSAQLPVGWGAALSRLCAAVGAQVIFTPTLTLTLNPNSDPNPNPDPKP